MYEAYMYVQTETRAAAAALAERLTFQSGGGHFRETAETTTT